MHTGTFAAALASLFGLSASLPAHPAEDEARSSPIHGHIEFLWEAPARDSEARPVALGLLTRPEAPHLACWKSAAFPQRAVEVRLEIDDAHGRHPLWVGTETGAPLHVVRCRNIDLAALKVAPGMRRVVLRFDGRIAAQETIEVAASLATAAFHRGDRSFVNGRTPYLADIAPADYSGRFVWVLTFGPDGRVIAVETEVAEGLAATRLRAAGEEAAWLYRIGADPGKPERKLRQPYDLLPGH
ncbi:hypothetical protein [Luteimonas terrae]|uniref:Uncharacterized protein n=1 Tax=Luteimonas terrae TaxID=1530191 RepID=A0ABU1Y081_9GAMM|nr:hypothetical protein [Luteimonas terrae]MDR7194430.1 hypothetical protein [Luteimonas terrae]